MPIFLELAVFSWKFEVYKLCSLQPLQTMAAWGAERKKQSTQGLILLWQTTVSTRGMLCQFEQMAGNFLCLKNTIKMGKGGRRATGPARWRVMLHGGPERCKTWLFSFHVYSLKKKDYWHKKSILKHSCPFPPCPCLSPCQSISQLFRNTHLLSEVTRRVPHSYSCFAETPSKTIHLEQNCSSDW